MALSLPSTLAAGDYQLEAGPAALLAPDGDDGFSEFLGLFGSPEGDAEETLEDVFARLNGEDQNVLLMARLTPPMGDLAFVGPDQEEGEWEPAVSVQEDVGFVLQGSASLTVRVVAE